MLFIKQKGEICINEKKKKSFRLFNPESPATGLRDRSGRWNLRRAGRRSRSGTSRRETTPFRSSSSGAVWPSPPWSSRGRSEIAPISAPKRPPTICPRPSQRRSTYSWCQCSRVPTTTRREGRTSWSSRLSGEPGRLFVHLQRRLRRGRVGTGWDW